LERSPVLLSQHAGVVAGSGLQAQNRT